jgi:hypothetical protein
MMYFVLVCPKLGVIRALPVVQPPSFFWASRKCEPATFVHGLIDSKAANAPLIGSIDDSVNTKI